MSTYKQAPNDITRFVDMLRAGIPTLIEQGTGGDVVQTAERDLLPLTANGDVHFAIYLSSGAAYRIRVQQIGEAEIGEAGCQQCGELMPAHELDQHGSCPECGREQWDAMSAEEQAEWCRVHKQHFPFEAKGPMSPEQLEWIRRLLESHPWRLARTQPHNPRSYTLRRDWQDVGDDVFNEVVRMIREHGYTEWFGTYPWRTLDASEHRYWTYFSARVEDVTLINRKPIDMTGQGKTS